MIHLVPSMVPIAAFQECSLDDANRMLIAWSRKMGPLNRGTEGYAKPGCYVLLHEQTAVAVTTHSTLIRDHVGGGLGHITRTNGIELSRLCAARPHLCRVAIRCWREFVFAGLGIPYAISYQDADLHSGNTYRFDGWKRSPEQSRSGTDSRATGLAKKGRTKWIWYYEVAA